MKTIKRIFVLLLISTMTVVAQEKIKEKPDSPVLTGPYLGQKPPGMKPEPFAPNLLPDCKYSA